MITPENKFRIEVLSKARELISKGWFRGADISTKGSGSLCYCLQGACRKVLSNRKTKLPNELPDWLKNHQDSDCRKIQNLFIYHLFEPAHKGIEDMGVPAWNDMPSRKKLEVLNAIDMAIEFWQDGKNQWRKFYPYAR